MARFMCLLAALTLAACATANRPVDSSALGSVHVLVGDASAVQQMQASDEPSGPAAEFAPSEQPKRVYWYLAGR